MSLLECTADEKAALPPINVGFLIRSHNPTEAMVKRILQWIQELNSKETDNTRFAYFPWISIDATHANEYQTARKLREAFEQCLTENTDFFIHEYVESEIIQQFPNLLEAEGIKHASVLWREWRPNATLAWGFHLECISLWMHDPRVKAQNLDMVWVIEDDVGCTVTIGDFIQLYDAEHQRADLVSKMYHEVNRAVDKNYDTGWCWFDTCSSKYGELVGGESGKGRYCSPEHMQRFSWNYLCKLDELMRNESCHAWSEQATPTLCIKLGLEFCQFDEAHLGTPYSWDGKILEDAWDAIVSEHKGKFKIYHALKY
jgi:hypothetical protein